MNSLTHSSSEVIQLRPQVTCTENFVKSGHVFKKISPPLVPVLVRLAEYKRSFSVCVRVCPRAYLRNYTSDKFLCLLPMAVTPFSSAWRRWDTLCTSGFTDDVIFAHHRPYGDMSIPLQRHCVVVRRLTPLLRRYNNSSINFDFVRHKCLWRNNF